MKYESKDDRMEAEGFVDLDTGIQEYHCPASDYEILLGAWKRGEAFVHTRTLYDEDTVIKLAKIESITLVTPEAYKVRLHTDKIRKEKSLLEDN